LWIQAKKEVIKLFVFVARGFPQSNHGLSTPNDEGLSGGVIEGEDWNSPPVSKLGHSLQ